MRAIKKSSSAFPEQNKKKIKLFLTASPRFMEMKQQLLELGRAGEPGWKTGGGGKQGKKIKT